MNTILFTHPACFDHDPGYGHPESAERLRTILATLDSEAFALLDRRQAPLATVEQVARAHPLAYVERILELVPGRGYVDIDNDTVMSPGSGEAALRAAGAVVASVDAIVAGEARNAFCAVRPPGHHAERARPMGFCLFNNVAVGAAHARAVHGLKRVAVIDFDVHHGNGTQDIFWHEPDLMYVSTHQSPLYPGTGAAAETGINGNILNVPLPPMSGSPEFRQAVTHQILPALEAFGPDLILLSAGFDAHSLDPLANLHFVEADYAWVTGKIGALAARICQSRLISVLEGGYNLHALSISVDAHVKELMSI